MFHLNTIDPVKWDHREIARTWGVTVPRVRAILRLKALEHHRRARGTLFDEVQDDSGTATLVWDYVGHPFHYMDLKEVAVSDFDSLKVREDDDRYWKKVLNWKVPPRKDSLPKPDAKRIPIPKSKKSRFKYVFTDMSTKGENLMSSSHVTLPGSRRPAKGDVKRVRDVDPHVHVEVTVCLNGSPLPDADHLPDPPHSQQAFEAKYGRRSC